MNDTTTRPHLLICVTHFYPDKGGLEKYVEELYSRLAIDYGYQIDIISIRKEGPRYEEYRGIKIHRVSPLIEVSDVFAIPNIRDWRRTIKKIETKRPIDLVITQTRFFLTSFLGARYAISSHKNYIHTEHGCSPVIHPNRIIALCARLFDLTLGTYVMRRAAKVVAISKPGVHFCRSLGAVSIEYIPNGIDTRFWKPQEDDKHMHDPLKLLFIGRLHAAKGLDYLIDAVATLPFEAELSVVGGGPDEDRLLNYIKKNNLTPHIKMLGILEPQEIKKLLSDTDIFINPSLNEGLPTVVLEALSMGVPTIATDVGGTRDIIQTTESGVLVAAGKSEDIQKAVIQLVNSKHKSPTLINNRIAEVYDWSVIAKKFDSLLRLIAEA